MKRKSKKSFIAKTFVKSVLLATRCPKSDRYSNVKNDAIIVMGLTSEQSPFRTKYIPWLSQNNDGHKDVGVDTA